MSKNAILLSLGAVLCWGVGAIFDKLAVKHLDPTVAFFCRFYLLFLIIAPFLVRGWHDHKLAMLGAPKVVPFYLLGSVATYAFGMYVYYHAMSQAEASKVVPFTSVYPLVTFVASVALLSEPITWSKLLGTLLVVSGTFVLSK